MRTSILLSRRGVKEGAEGGGAMFQECLEGHSVFRRRTPRNGETRLGTAFSKE